MKTFRSCICRLESNAQEGGDEVRGYVVTAWVEGSGCRVEGLRGWGQGLQGYLAHKKHPLLGPYGMTITRVLRWS